MTRVIIATLVWGLVACGGAEPAPPIEALALMVSSPEPLPEVDEQVVVSLSVGAVSLAETLRRYWGAPRGPSAIDRLDEQLDAMTSDLSRATSSAVDAEYRPYLRRWRRLRDALVAHHEALVGDDDVAAAAAEVDYDRSIAEITERDSVRLQRVAAELGGDEAVDALIRAGVPVIDGR